jgi:Uncharacterized conserved protein
MVLFALVLAFAQPVSAAEVVQDFTIDTSATSIITVDPDAVQLSLNIRTEEKSASLSQENNANAVNKVIDSLLSEGLTNDEIKTTSYSTYSYTKSDSDKNENEITVYSTNSGLEANFKALNKVGEILNKLANISEVNVNSVNYSIQDPAKYKEQIIAAAIAEAKQNILYSAEALGVKLDKLDHLTIDFNSGNQTFPRNPVALKEAASTSQPQNPDKISISATANMSYLVQQ